MPVLSNAEGNATRPPGSVAKKSSRACPEQCHPPLDNLSASGGARRLAASYLRPRAPPPKRPNITPTPLSETRPKRQLFAKTTKLRIRIP